MDESLSLDHFPLIDEIDHEILMHRDAHFGGLFSIMIDYYKDGGKGSQPEFELKRIKELEELEIQLKQNLAALFLTAQEIERVGDAKKAYKNLRDICELKKTTNLNPKLIAELILSEDEEPQEEIEALVKQKETVVPLLIDLLKKDELRDVLYPGYGKAAESIIRCLKRIGDKRAIIALFESIGTGDFFFDELIIEALKAIGDPAKRFLLTVLNKRPLNEDNEKAAIALKAFKEDKEVISSVLTLLEQPEVQQALCLPTYLALLCMGIQDPVQKQQVKLLSLNEKLPLALRQDLKNVLYE